MRLIVVKGPWKGAEIDLEGDEVRIGRDAECEVALPDTALSRQHVALRRDGDDWTVVDLGSRNGSELNGEPLSEPRRLRRGDRLAAGRSVFVVESAPAALVAGPSATTTILARPGGPAGDPLAALYHLTDALGAAPTLDGFAARLAASLREQTGAAEVRVYRRRHQQLREWTGPWSAGGEAPDLVLDPEVAAQVLDRGETAWLQEEARVVVPVGAPAMLAVVLEAPSRIERDSDLRFSSCAGHVAAGLYRNALRLQSAERPHAGSSSPLVAASPAMQKVRATVDKIAPADVTVVITGESGTGKEVVARAIHRASDRATAAFVAINCAAIPESLIESELFGHERGAFTGATESRAGHFERASGGTVLLDEIGEMPPASQAKLLRVLEDRTVQRVGGAERIPIDVRVIAATNRDLGEAVEQGRFRDDLYHRLAVVTIELPPLRDRPEDIEALAGHFIAGAGGGRVVTGLSPEALDALVAYHWPGNVRQLRNVIERALIFAESERVERADLGPEIAAAEADPDAPPSAFVKLPMRLDELEKRAVFAALKASGGNKSQAARTLGVDRVTIYNKLRSYGQDS